MSDEERNKRKEELMEWGKPNLCIYIINLERRLKEEMKKEEIEA